MGKKGKSGDYTVGYGKPPKEHQFPPRTSGNPKGAPRKDAKRSALASAVASFGNLDISDIVLQEAYREVTVREGEKSNKISSTKAVFRSIISTAFKNNVPAQKFIFDIFRKAEENRLKIQASEVYAMRKYILECTKKIEAARAAGEPEPQLIPHPDDIITDLRTGEVRVCGPRTIEEKERWDKDGVVSLTSSQLGERARWRAARPRHRARGAASHYQHGAPCRSARAGDCDPPQQ